MFILTRLNHVAQSIGIGADDFAAGLGAEARESGAGDGVLDEANAAVNEQRVHAAGVESGGGEGVAAVVALARVALAAANVHGILVVVRHLSDVEGTAFREGSPAPAAVAGDLNGTGVRELGGTELQRGERVRLVGRARGEVVILIRKRGVDHDAVATIFAARRAGADAAAASERITRQPRPARNIT